MNKNCFKKASLKNMIIANFKVIIHNFNKKISLYNKLDKIILYNDTKF